MATIIVIGAGVIGTSIAANLAQRGERPLVLERAHVCSGTTGQSGGVVRQHYSNPATAAMARDALTIFRNWADHYDGDPGFTSVGVMLTAGPETEAGIRSNVAEHIRLGIETSLLEPDIAKKIDERIVVSDCTAVCYEPTSGIADTIATNHAFANTARNLGATIREQTSVEQIVVESGRVVGVETTNGPIPADIVINAAGAWGLRFMRALGHDLPISFSRHPMALIRRATDDNRQHPAVLDVHTDSYFLPKGDLTLVGKLGTMPSDENVDPDGYLQGVTNEEISRYQQAARRRLPTLERGTVLGGWAGIYDDSIDAHPVVDAVPGVEGLYCALGMSGNCFKLSPVIGALLASRIVSGPESAPELDLFRFSRFFDGTAHERAFGNLSVIA